jgi:hypothetical protein
VGAAADPGDDVRDAVAVDVAAGDEGAAEVAWVVGEEGTD